MQLQSPSQSPPSSAATKTTVSVLLATLFFSVLFLLSLSSSTTSSSTRPDPSLFPSSVIFPKTPSDPAPPAVAYFISASKGDSARILRLLFATYHPRNFYLLHLDGFASQTERNNLALTVQSVPIFKAAQNIDVIGKPDFAYSSGSSPISATLHGASMLLRMSDRWVWFVNLSAGDYPLVTQDDLLHILSFLPRELNFVNHSSYIGWRESRKLKPIIVDPGLYLSEKSVMFFASQKRNLPDAFRLFSATPREGVPSPERVLSAVAAAANDAGEERQRRPREGEPSPSPSIGREITVSSSRSSPEQLVAGGCRRRRDSVASIPSPPSPTREGKASRALLLLPPFSLNRGGRRGGVPPANSVSSVQGSAVGPVSFLPAPGVLDLIRKCCSAQIGKATTWLSLWCWVCICWIVFGSCRCLDIWYV